MKILIVLVDLNTLLSIDEELLIEHIITNFADLGTRSEMSSKWLFISFLNM